MSEKKAETFIVDCPDCEAKVAVMVNGKATRSGYYGDPDGGNGEPYGFCVCMGNCPKCDLILVGESEKVDIAEYNAMYDSWSDYVRVYPKPAKSFLSNRIPRNVKESLTEANRCLQTSANTAACVMLGRAMEGIFQHLLLMHESGSDTKKPKKIMLDQGIKQLQQKNLLEKRFVDWSQHLRAFRNMAAHPGEDVQISRQEAEDLQTFVYAMIEYIYDLAERYDEFLDRVSARERKKKKVSERH